MANGAPQVVLASLTIDAQGAVTGSAQISNALLGAGRSAEDFVRKGNSTAQVTDLLSRRMFNLKTAVIAVVGGFSLAGVLLSLRSFVESAITATTWWRRFIEGLEDTVRAAFLAESAVDALARKVQGFGKEFGVETLTGTNLQIDKLRDKIKGLTALKTAAIWTAVGTEDELAAQAEKIRILTIDIERFTQALGKLLVKRLEMEGFKLPTSIETVPQGRALELQDPFAGDLQGRHIRDPFERHILSMQELRSVSFDVLDAFHQMGADVPLTLNQIVEAAEKSRGSIKENQFAAEAFGVAMQAVGGAIIAAFLGGGDARKNLFKDVARQVAGAMLFKALEYTAYGIAASTGIGALTLQGSPSQFFAAAGKFLAAGAAAAVFAGGGGGGSRGAGAGAGVAAPEPVIQSRQTVVQVEISGPVFGTSRDELVRNLAGGLREALGDQFIIEAA